MSVVSVASSIPPSTTSAAAAMLAPVAQRAAPGSRGSGAGSAATQTQATTTSSGEDTTGTIDGVTISCGDIQKVQNLIEKCLQLYMSQEEVVKSLKEEAQIQPSFTTLVWQKLEEQNPEFFRAYYTRLKLKDQIVLFNHLLEQQVQMFQKIQAGWVQPANPQLIAGQIRPGMQIQTLPQNVSGGFPRPPVAAPATAAMPVAQQVVAAPSSAAMPPPASRTAALVTGGKQNATAQNSQQKSAKQSQQKQPASDAQRKATLPKAVSDTTSLGFTPEAATGTPANGVVSLGDSAGVLGMAPGSTVVPAPAQGTIDGAAALAEQGQMPKSFSLSDLNLDLHAMPGDNNGTLELLNGQGAGELDIDMPMAI